MAPEPPAMSQFAMSPAPTRTTGSWSCATGAAAWRACVAEAAPASAHANTVAAPTRKAGAVRRKLVIGRLACDGSWLVTRGWYARWASPAIEKRRASRRALFQLVQRPRVVAQHHARQRDGTVSRDVMVTQHLGERQPERLAARLRRDEARLLPTHLFRFGVRIGCEQHLLRHVLEPPAKHLGDAARGAERRLFREVHVGVWLREERRDFGGERPAAVD